MFYEKSDNKVTNSVLYIEPVGEFENQRPVLASERLGYIVFSVDNKEIARRFIAPLEPRVEIDVVKKSIILGKGCEEYLAGEGYVEPGTHNKKLFASIISRELEVIVVESHGHAAVWLVPQVDLSIEVKIVAIIKASRRRSKHITKDLSLVGLKED